MNWLVNPRAGINTYTVYLYQLYKINKPSVIQRSRKMYVNSNFILFVHIFFSVAYDKLIHVCTWIINSKQCPFGHLIILIKASSSGKCIHSLHLD